MAPWCGTSSWSDETLPGTSSAEPLAAFTPGIAFTGFNLVLTAVQWTSFTPSSESLDDACHHAALTGQSDPGFLGEIEVYPGAG